MPGRRGPGRGGPGRGHRGTRDERRGRRRRYSRRQPGQQGTDDGCGQPPTEHVREGSRPGRRPHARAPTARAEAYQTRSRVSPFSRSATSPSCGRLGSPAVPVLSAYPCVGLGGRGADPGGQLGHPGRRYPHRQRADHRPARRTGTARPPRPGASDARPRSVPPSRPPPDPSASLHHATPAGRLPRRI